MNMTSESLCATCGHTLAQHRETELGDCWAPLGTDPQPVCTCREYMAAPVPVGVPLVSIHQSEYDMLLKLKASVNALINHPSPLGEAAFKALVDAGHDFRLNVGTGE